MLLIFYGRQERREESRDLILVVTDWQPAGQAGMSGCKDLKSDSEP